MERKELLFTVNPVFATAKGCLGLLKKTGLKEAEELGSLIDTTVPTASQTPPDILRCYMISNEARYHIGNIIAEESDCDVIVDLPCGYVPRGLVITEKGKPFYGFDLPAVIEELEPAIRSIASEKQNELMHFCAVDATNYDSMKQALGSVKGKLCILTDGLLGYFNKPELDSFCTNVQKLLTEYGGIWVTADKYARTLAAVTFNTLTDSDGEIVKKMMQKGGAKVADIPVNHTVIADGSVEETIEYFKKHGFEIQTVSYAEKLPDLSSLRDCPDEMKKLRETYRDVMLWIMSVKPAQTKKSEKTVEAGAFRADFSREGGHLLCRISGRLDTITAPDLLTGLNEYQNEDLKEITLDLKDMVYISSAGLRVLMILYKSIPAPENFHLINISKDVMNILDVTGFTTIFNL